MTGVIHELKCLTRYFKDVVSGVKTFEIREDDRGYEVGDFLYLREFWESHNPQYSCYTSAAVLVKVTYMTAYGQKPGYVVMGFEKQEGSEVE